MPDILENALIAMLDFLGLKSVWIKFLKEVNPEKIAKPIPIAWIKNCVLLKSLNFVIL